METEITEGNIDEIKRRLQYIHENFNVEVTTEPIKIGDEDIFFDFPDDEYMEESLSILDFFQYTNEIKSLTLVDDKTVRSNNIRQTIIRNNDNFYNLPILGEWISTDDYSVNIVENPFYIGLISSKEKMYNESYGIYACSSYHAVEIIYSTENRLNEQEETSLIKQLLFTLSCKFNDSITIGSFLGWSDLDDKVSQEYDEVQIIKDMIPYTPAMEMYTEALSIYNEEIKFLYLYKIIEYFSPIVAKKASYELLNQKLDTLSISKRDYKYLDSIFDLTRKYDQSIRDKELAFTVLRECIDVIELYQYLPENINKVLCKVFQFSDIHSIDEDKKLSIIKKIANILYATRNNFVHAKSNYYSTGDECREEDLKQLNEFMTKLCYCLIVWNGRQSEDFRI